MDKNDANTGAPCYLSRDDFDRLLAAIRRRGFDTIGPRVEDSAIVYDTLSRVSDLPEGWIDNQEPAKYRLKKTKSKALFDHVVGPQSLKKYLYPAEQKLFSATRRGKGFDIHDADLAPEKYAFIGVRACDLAALAIHDKVFDNGDFADEGYRRRRGNSFIVAINCGRAAETCFCTSMNSGPKATTGFDIALTELPDKTGSSFIAKIGSDEGRKILASLKLKAAPAASVKAAEARVQKTAKSIKRKMIPDIAGVLSDTLEHKRWDKIAERCLNCANCTMVCPTCFCSTVEDVTDLSGENAERWRKWDSCFTLDFSYIHGGSIRREGAARYRQWMTHKLLHWHDQFGSSGCTGCGRCITWCPVGIDITEEARLLRDEKGRA